MNTYSRWMSHVLATVALLAAGYVAGSYQLLTPEPVEAADESEVSEEAKQAVQAAFLKLKEAVDALKQDGKYKPATNGLNSFAVLCGGVDAIDDLENGRGVDPETFAALYAGDAIDTVGPELGKDEDGRLTYKGKVVRIYSPARLKAVAKKRAKVTGETGAISTK